MTLMTRVGGIIGVGKEFLWILLFLLAHGVTLYKYVIPYLIWLNLVISFEAADYQILLTIYYHFWNIDVRLKRKVSMK